MMPVSHSEYSFLHSCETQKGQEKGRDKTELDGDENVVLQSEEKSLDLSSWLLDAIRDSQCIGKIQSYFDSGGQSTLKGFHLALDLMRDNRTLELLWRDNIQPTCKTLRKAFKANVSSIMIDKIMNVGSIQATTQELNQALKRNILPVTIFSIIKSGAKADDTSLQLAIDHDYSDEIIQKLCENLL